MKNYTYKVKNPTAGTVVGLILVGLLIFFLITLFFGWLLMLGLGGLASGGLGKAVGLWQAYPMAVFLVMLIGGKVSTSK